jgi:RNA polymerase sigma factor (sigma-70 family)
MQMMTEGVTVFIVDDDPAMRESMSFLVRSVGVAVETYPSAQNFLDDYDPARAGCLVLDVRMPGMSGLELQELLVERNVRLPVIMITGYGDVPMAVRALQGGATAFLEKPFTDQELLEQINLAIESDRQRRAEAAELARISELIARLTPRERQVMDLVYEGKANKAIGAELGINHKTVEVHRSRVMAKLQVSSLAALLRMILAYRMSATEPLHPNDPGSRGGPSGQSPT